MTAITVPILGTAHDAAFFQLAELTSSDLFAVCYTDGTHAYSQVDIDHIRSVDKGIAAVHENAANELAGGAVAGRAAAIRAMAAVKAWGMPPDGTCAISFVADLTVANTATSFAPYVNAYTAIRAVLGVQYKIGFYGELALYKYLKARGLVDVCCFLAAAASWPGWNPNDPDVGLVQTVGTDIASTDRDLVTSYDLGVWWVEGHDPSGGGTPIHPPTPVSKDTDMSFRMVQDPRSPAQWAMGDTWAIGMANGAEYAVWASDPDCVNPAAIYAPDPAHWDQKWRRMVLVQPADGKSLGDALTALIAPLVTAGSIDLASVASAASAGAQGGASAALNGATVTSIITKPASPATG